MPTYKVYIRDGAYQPLAELTDWLSLDLVLRFNGVGTWVLETSSQSIAAALLTKTGGIVVTCDNVVIFSGSVSTEWTRTGNTFRAAGKSDDELLETAARPTPSLNVGPFPDEYDVRTGVASTIMRQFVSAQIGPTAPSNWKIDEMSFPADPLLGSSATLRARLEPLITVLREFALTPYAGGLGFQLLQSSLSASALLFTVYAPVDRSTTVKFATVQNTAADFEDVWSAPPANYFYVLLGDGLGGNRTILEDGDPISIAAVGRRITAVIDKRGVTDTGEGEQALAEALAGAVASRKVTVKPFDLPAFSYGSTWNLGDLVTFIVSGESFVDLIREVHISLQPGQGAIATPVIGEAGSSDDDQVAQYIATVQDRVSNLERNWNIPPNSIDDSMLVGSLRPAIGKIEWLAGATIPTGYLASNGQSVLRASYPDLFAAIGTVWGAADGTHFNVPNLQGRFPIGANGSTFLLGATGGASTINIAAHSHSHSHSHSHGGGTLAYAHTHASQAHTHPGSHTHDRGTLAVSHDHTVNIDHDHASFNSGGENTFAATFSTYPGVTTNVSHNHVVDVPALGTTNKTSNTPNNISWSGATGSDSNAPAASYSGSASGVTGGTWTGGTDADATTDATTGGAVTSLSVLNPYAVLNPCIYAGA